MLNRMVLVVLLTIASATVETAQTPAVKSYYNKEYKVGLKYPAAWKLTKQDDDGKDTHLGWFEPPRASLRGQLKEATVGLWVVGYKMNQDECRSFRDEEGNWEQEKAVAKKVGALTFYQKTASDGAAGSVGISDYFRIHREGRCYTLMFKTFAVNAPQDDRYVKAVRQQFDAILRSFYFAK